MQGYKMRKGQRDLETDEEHLKLVEVADEFWRKFSALCNEYMDKAPADLYSYYEMFLGEKTSMYGRDVKAIPLKVFTCNNFEGVWPVPTAAVMIAKDKDEAARLLLTKMKENNLSQPDTNPLKIEELAIEEGKISMLSIGEY